MIPKCSNLLVLCYSLLSINSKHIAEGLAEGPRNQFPSQWQGSVADPQNAADDNMKGVPKIICVYYVPPKETSGEIDAISDLCTHVIFDCAKLENNKLILMKDDSGWLTVIAAMRKKGLKVMIRIGGWIDSDDNKPMPSKYSLLVRDRKNREEFLQSVMMCLDSYKFDGLEIDWRYPKYWQADLNRVEPNDRADFASLIEELSREFKKKGLLLSSTGTPWSNILDGYDIPKLIQYLDWISLLTCNYQLKRDGRTSTHSPLYEDPINGKGSTNYTVYSWMSGNKTYRSKLVITVPSFGITFTLQNANHPNIGEKIVKELPQPIRFVKLCQHILKDKWTYVPDPNRRVGPYAYFNAEWTSFNDPAMAEEKGRYANQLGLGVAVHIVEGDDRRNACGCGPFPLLRAINIGIGRLHDSIENCSFFHKSLPSKLRSPDVVSSSKLKNVHEVSLSKLENEEEVSSSKLKNMDMMLAGFVVTVMLILLLLSTIMLFKKRRRDAKKMRPMKFFGNRRVAGNTVIKKTETGFEVRGDESDRNRMWSLGAIETGWKTVEPTSFSLSRNREQPSQFSDGVYSPVNRDRRPEGKNDLCSLVDQKRETSENGRRPENHQRSKTQLIGSNGETIAAVKTLKEVASVNNRLDLLAEVEVMKRLGSHPHVVSFLGCCTDRDPILILLEYIPGGKLQNYLRKSRGKHEYCNLHGVSSLTSTDLLAFGCHAAGGMEYLSSKGIVHRDLAARNILIDDNTKTCKIADFGLARDLENGLVYEKSLMAKYPSDGYPPESLYDNVFTIKSDVWSFGVLLWEIVALGSTPYPGLSANEVMKRILRGYRLEKPKYCEDELYDVMQWCWKKNPEERPSFSEIVQSLENLLECGLEYINLKEVDDDYQFVDVAENSEEKV